ncbi:tetratricopeptide repeat-containing sulfotransferase family protein [Aestuariivirga sp.]|uniref:tetratricopeptide repeat-containing sulfotransferase family protein n=1 Tax=Aestuariivirga sp. TaxID=2650926 RepID=UPI0039E6B849
MNIETEVRAIFKLFGEGRFDLALAKAQALHRQAPQLPVSNYCMGHALAALQRPRDAVPFLRKAAQLEPRNVDFLVRFGRALLDSGRVREAESVLMKARDINPSLPIVPWTLGVFYASIDRFDKAVEHYSTVMSLKLPHGFDNNAKLDWAFALIEVGRTKEAEVPLRELLNDPKARGTALAHLAAIEPFPLDSPEFAMLEQELLRSDHSAMDRSVLLHTKARCLSSAKDIEGEYALLRESKLVRAKKDTSEAFGRQVDSLISVFSQENIAELSKIAGDNPFQPIHVLGLPRSGTTLVERILASHSTVAGAGELEVVAEFVRTVLNGHAVTEFLALARKMGGAALRQQLNEIEATMRFLGNGKDRIVDKMPHNFLFVGLLAAVFPKGSIVHCFRHPADNFLSGFKANLLDAHFYFDDPAIFISYFGHYRRLMEHWYRVLPGRIFPLHYERLVTEPKPMITSLLSFCQLGWEEDCLYPEQGESRIATASVHQARSPINAKSVGGWTKYQSRLQIIADTCGEGDFTPLANPGS